MPALKQKNNKKHLFLHLPSLRPLPGGLGSTSHQRPQTVAVDLGKAGVCGVFGHGEIPRVNGWVNGQPFQMGCSSTNYKWWNGNLPKADIFCGPWKVWEWNLTTRWWFSKIFVMFIPGKNIIHFESYFSMGLKRPTRPDFLVGSWHQGGGGTLRFWLVMCVKLKLPIRSVFFHRRTGWCCEITILWP